jgi:glutamate N-acetyltransferase/amino-acid N-acetyltransferase
MRSVVTLQEIEGSVCAPTGFRAAGVAGGIKHSGDPDVALIVADRPCTAAAVFSTNRVAAAPVQVSRQHVKVGKGRAIVANSGNANSCTGAQGLADAYRMAELAAEVLGVTAEEVLVASTGVIGHQMPMERIEAGIRAAAGQLAIDGDPAARAIMTTDTRPKQIAVEARVEDVRLRVGGIAKGSGMIGPHLATMLAFVTSDVSIWPEALQAALRSSVERSINCVTVDGDCSTNDCVFVLANGASGANAVPGSPIYQAFSEALLRVCTHLAKELARDGEGATKLVEVTVSGARSVGQARQVGMTIANSPLVKTALFGNDPNWGRILMAAGRSGVAIDPDRLCLVLAGIPLVRDGEPLGYDPQAARRAMDAAEVGIDLDLGQGRSSATVWTCDFSYDYVRINAEYHT